MGSLDPTGRLAAALIWDGNEHVDPAKETNAQATRQSSHTSTLANEYAKHGRDWETELRQRAKEVALIREHGLTAPGSEEQHGTSVAPASALRLEEEDDA